MTTKYSKVSVYTNANYCHFLQRPSYFVLPIPILLSCYITVYCKPRMTFETTLIFSMITFHNYHHLFRLIRYNN